MLSYLDDADVRFFGNEMRSMITQASKSDIQFQFWELFLNSGLRRVRKDDSLQSSHDRLLLSYFTNLDKSRVLKIEASKTRILEKEMNSHIRSYRDVQEDINELHDLCFGYQMNCGPPGWNSPKYESFRFLVINTFIHYFIDDSAYGFRVNGVSDFFDKILDSNSPLRETTVKLLTDGPDVRAISSNVRAMIKVEYLESAAMRIDDYFVPGAKHEVEVSDQSSDKYRAVQFLKSVAVNADKLTGLVIARFNVMSLSCMRIFFNDSINVYLPWMPAGSSGKLGSKTEPTRVFPANKLAETAGLIYHEINWRSYTSYNEIAANRSPLFGGTPGAHTRANGDSLGVMVRWPIRQGITHDGRQSDGVFEVGGFVRTMRRYSKGNSKIIEPDSYTDEQWEMDRLIVEPLVQMFSARIGQRLSFKE